METPDKVNADASRGTISPKKDGDAPIRFEFLLVPNYSMIAFVSAVEPLRMANLLSGRELYQWRTFTSDGQPVAASNGLTVSPHCAIRDAGHIDTLFVCGGLDIQRACDKDLLFWLRKLTREKVVLGALCTGSYLLARANLLSGYRCTIHWENMASMREEYPDVIVSPELFEIDRDRYTCAGGTAALDMMLHIIRRQQGAELVAAISEQFMCERIRDEHDRQRIPLRMQVGGSQPKLTEAVALMEANLEEPMSLDELAEHAGISRRQLERLFQKYLHCVPTRYYLELRLTRARQLLLQTSMSIVEVALACGFVSAPHFSKCYRDFFGLPPREERRTLKPDGTRHNNR
jgi:transcriptional regulator GlxA family with amidase domain